MKKIKLNQDGKISGESAFVYATSYGIPLEVLEAETGARVEMSEYKRLFEEHRKVSKKSANKLFKNCV
jgi:alanyl-tRNA synthetase